MDLPQAIEGSSGFSLPAAPGAERYRALLIHGFTGSPHDFYRAAPALAERGVSVTTIRLPGHGTTWQDLLTVTYADWWQEAMTSLQAVASDGPVWIIGNSFGACIALDLAARYPQLVKGIISVGICLWLNQEFNNRLVLPYVSIFGGRAAKPYVPAEHHREFLARGYYLYVPMGALYQMYAFNRRYTMPALPWVTCPVLLLHAREDNVTRSQSSQYVAYHVSGPATVELVPGSNHDLLDDEEHTPQVIKRIIQFIERFSNGEGAEQNIEHRTQNTD